MKTLRDEYKLACVPFAFKWAEEKTIGDCAEMVGVDVKEWKHDMFSKVVAILCNQLADAIMGEKVDA